jgi:hypothetical protein
VAVDEEAQRRGLTRFIGATYPHFTAETSAGVRAVVSDATDDS